MDKQVLLGLLHQPEFLKDDLLEELNEIIQKHPYFAIPHILLAKSLHDQGSNLAPQKIRRAALYAYNRSILKKFIMEKPIRIKAEEEVSFSPPENIYRNPFGEIQEELEAFDKKMETLSPEDLDKELASITESYIPKEYTLETPELNTELELTENQKQQNSLIDQFLKGTSFSSSIETNTQETDSEEYAIALFEKGDVQGAIAVYERLKLQHPEKESYYQSQINIFSMSLDDIVTDEKLISTPESTQTDLQIDTDSLLQEILNVPKIEQPATEKMSETYQTSNESSTTEIHQPETQEQTSQSFESSVNSTLSDDEISEEKALAYFNEGNTAKAIEIYRKLMLQIPEKKAYFASQIEILES
ncbi:MAG: tetratricopeptide repeat protein [Raineya sp.]|nr:tetratricopeptide repeat protein [Raineya sp.]